jgi:hypothetical protein
VGAVAGQLHPCGHVAVADHDPANALTVPFSSSSVDNAWNAGGQGFGLNVHHVIPLSVGPPLQLNIEGLRAVLQPPPDTDGPVDISPVDGDLDMTSAW